MDSIVKKPYVWLIILASCLNYNNLQACHALGLQNPSINVTPTGVEVDADSDPATCATGCNNSVYWMDIEIRCVGENFNPAPFNPGFYGPIFSYPFFQSAQMQKPNCVLQSYPTTFIPFGSLCPGDYQIRFRENHNGSVGPWTVAFNFTIPGTAPTLTANATAVKDTVCAGECTVLAGSVTGGCGLAPTYSWSTGSSNSQINVCPTSDSIFTVTITELCSNTTAQASIEIIVIPSPSAGTASSDQSSVCEGETVNLTLVNYEDDLQWESAPSQNGPWSDIPGATTDNIVSPPISANEKCFRARVGDCGTPSYSNVVCIAVNDIPSIEALDTSICEGEVIDISTSVSSPGGDYYWDYDGSNGSTLTGLSPTDTSEYIVSYTQNGCIAEDTSQVVVFKSPTALFELDSVCFSQESSFIDVSTLDNSNGDQIVDWDWSFGDGNSSIGQSPYHTYGSEGVYDVRLIVTTNNGCTDSIVEQTLVYPLPEPNFNLTDACQGFENEFTDNSQISNQYSNNSIDNYDWSFDDGTTSNEINPNHLYDDHGSYDVQLLLTSNHGCADSLTKTAVVHPKPQPNFEADTTVSCDPLCFNLSSTSTIDSPSNIVSYTWKLNGNTVQSNDQSSYSDCIQNNSTNSTYHDVELITESNEGCIDSLKIEDLLTVYHNPFADFSYLPEYVDVIETEVEFTNKSIGEDSVYWTFGTFEQSTDSNPTVEFPAVGGDYNVNLLAITDEGCRDSVNVFITVDNRILYFAPNTFTPDGDQFNQEFKIVFPEGFTPQDFKLLIFNRWGEVIFESYDHLVGWDGTYGSDTGRKADEGTYVWKLEFKEIETDKRYTQTGHITILR
tara:strand:+ start:390 stop:2909 length:2520 start_codon:yes stop_codon:yes gene_type:complete